MQDAFWKAYSRFSQKRALPKRITEAAEAISLCKTGAFGSFFMKCPDDHVATMLHKPCWNRSCPMCRFNATETWIEGWRSRMLDSAYHHVIFTIPSELRVLWRFNERAMPDVLFHAASHTLLHMMGEKEYCGGKAGVLAALHTWGQSLQLHPHLHCIVTAGGLSDDDVWLSAKKSFLLPIKELQRFYRGAFLKELKACFRRGDLRLPPSMRESVFYDLVAELWEKEWHVEVMERYEHANGVLEYLARYVRGGPIGNSRILAVDDESVVFRYQDNRENDAASAQKTMTLDIEEFLSRFLTHVPPKGLRTVRGFGLFANAAINRSLARAREALGQRARRLARKPSLLRFLEKKGEAHRACCPVCKQPLVYVYDVDRFAARRRAEAPP